MISFAVISRDIIMLLVATILIFVIKPHDHTKGRDREIRMRFEQFLKPRIKSEFWENQLEVFHIEINLKSQF